MKRWNTDELALPSLHHLEQFGEDLTPALVAVVTASAIRAAVPLTSGSC